VARRALIGLTTGLGGAVLGFIVGVAAKQQPADTLARSPSVPAAPPGLIEVAVDLGRADSRITLLGRWTTVQRGPRRAGGIVGTSSLSLALNPLEQAYGLAIVAAADDGQREVHVRLNAEDVGHWVVTTAWQMHALVLPPRTLKAGVNTIEFVVPPAPGDNLALAIDSLHVVPLEASAHADAALPRPTGALIDGYYAPEGGGERATSWSAGTRTVVGLLLKPSNAPYQVELTGAAFGPLQPLSVHAEVNGQSAGSAKVAASAKHTFDVPAGALAEGSNLIELVYEKTIKPSEVDSKSRDTRDIAIRIERVAVRPITSP